jgi:ATP-dependent Lon protease
LPDFLRQGINVHFARTYRDVFHYVFEDHRDDNALH